MCMQHMQRCVYVGMYKRDVCMCVGLYNNILSLYIIHMHQTGVSPVMVTALTFPCSLAQLSAALVYIGSLSISKMPLMK